MELSKNCLRRVAQILLQALLQENPCFCPLDPRAVAGFIRLPVFSYLNGFLAGQDLIDEYIILYMYLLMDPSVLTNVTAGVYFIVGFVNQIEAVLQNGPTVNVYSMSGAAADQPLVATGGGRRRSMMEQHVHGALITSKGQQRQRAVLQASSDTNPNVMVMFSLVYQNIVPSSSVDAMIYADIMT